MDGRDVRVVNRGRSGELIPQLGEFGGVKRRPVPVRAEEYDIDLDMGVEVLTAVNRSEAGLAQALKHVETARQSAAYEGRLAAAILPRFVEAATLGAEHLPHYPAPGGCAETALRSAVLMRPDIAQRLGS
jgi:hypothetical protein